MSPIGSPGLGFVLNAFGIPISYHIISSSAYSDSICSSFSHNASTFFSARNRIPSTSNPINSLSHPKSLSSTARATATTKPASTADFIDSSMSCEGSSKDSFMKNATADPKINFVPVFRRVFFDQITPVELYRCLVPESDVTCPSFLLESATNSGEVSRYCYVGANPTIEVIARQQQILLKDNRDPALKAKYTIPAELTNTTATRNSDAYTIQSDDPWKFMRQFSETIHAAHPPNLPPFAGGWVGYGGYDTVRYAEPKKMPFSRAPKDDRNLPDLHFGFYRDIFVIDLFSKMLYTVSWVDTREHDSLEHAYAYAKKSVDALVEIVLNKNLLSHLKIATIDINTAKSPRPKNVVSNMTKEKFLKNIDQCMYHLKRGDNFQIVISQRFERKSTAHPFSVYRSLRVVNPSPYMIYMQNEGSVLVASSPEILCRVQGRTITNRPLAGTRHRGKTEEEDKRLEKELLSDEKDLAEHRMLVDLGRNDVGKVSTGGSVHPTALLVIERFSHVMHISSTVVGELKPELSSWDALRSTLPAGTVSGAPKIRAMEVIDDLEPTKRGPYGGGIGFVGVDGDMNIALALRTIVIPTDQYKDNEWVYHLQAGAGIVLDSVAEAEYQETVNKSNALGVAIDLAESAFAQE